MKKDLRMLSVLAVTANNIWKRHTVPTHTDSCAHARNAQKAMKRDIQIKLLEFFAPSGPQKFSIRSIRDVISLITQRTMCWNRRIPARKKISCRGEKFLPNQKILLEANGCFATLYTEKKKFGGRRDNHYQCHQKLFVQRPWRRMDMDRLPSNRTL